MNSKLDALRNEIYAKLDALEQQTARLSKLSSLFLMLHVVQIAALVYIISRLP